MEAVYVKEKVYEFDQLPEEYKDEDPIVYRCAIATAYSASNHTIKALKYSFEWQIPDKESMDHLMTGDRIMVSKRNQVVSFEFINTQSVDHPDTATLWITDLSKKKAYSRQIKSGEDLKLPILRSSPNNSLVYFLIGPQTCRVTVIDYALDFIENIRVEPWDPLLNGFADVSNEAF